MTPELLGEFIFEFGLRNRDERFAHGVRSFLFILELQANSLAGIICLQFDR